jgi:hypothetical protein
MIKDYEGDERRQKAHWSLDKRVPITIIATLLLQTGGIIYGAAKMRSDVDETQRRISALEGKEEKNSVLSERVVRVEAMVEGVKNTVDRIERKIERTGR